MEIHSEKNKVVMLNKEIEMHIQNKNALQGMFNDQCQKLELAERWAL